MLYLIRDATGKIGAVYVGYIDQDGHERLLSPNVLHVSILNHWTRQATGATYPSGWRLKINDPQVQTSLTLNPELLNQELVVYQSTGNSYWEGAVTIHGQSAGTPVLGEGYVDGDVVECNFHGGQFNIRTGEVVAPPCMEPVKTYRARVENGMVVIEG